MLKYRILVIGDLHIPRRATQVPPKILNKIEQLAEKELFTYTFFTGDLVKYPEFTAFLNQNTKNKVFIVQGNMDYFAGKREAPIYEKLILSDDSIQNFKLTFGLTHGDQIPERGNHSQLEKLAMEKNYNILISGHTHQEEVHLSKNGILLINPGSVTGAWSFIASRIPSFIELDINVETGDIKVLLFQLDQKNDELTSKSAYFTYNNDTIIQKY